MYRYGRPGRELSLLARGQGMVGGDVELDCYSHDPNAYSLSGKPLVRPANSRSTKPFQPHKLNLPKTFVTRRGQMVLFTAPEDMIIGRPIGLHEREGTAQQAVDDLRTTGRLLESAMDYLTEDDFNTKHTAQEMDTSDSVLTQPGHFTKVYLSSLQKATENAKMPTHCAVEDIEEDDGESDSGLGQSNLSRLSAVSKLSPGNALVIPHGGDEMPPTEPKPGQSDILTLLKNEIHQQKNTSKTKKTTGKKRQRHSNKQSSTDSPNPLKPKTKKSESKPVKSKRKRNKKDSQQSTTKQHDCHTTETEAVVLSVGDQPITAVNLSPSNTIEGAGDEGAWSTRISRGEERRREVERKRMEKRELEAAKKKEMEERLRLEEEISGANKFPVVTVSDDDDESDTVSMTSVNSDTRGESPSHAPAMPPLSNQARLRAELDRSRLCQQRWLLQGCEEEVGLETVLVDADEALTLAREAAERRQQLLEEEERQQRLEEEQRRQQAELEEAARLKAAEILCQSSIKPSSDNKKRLNSELSSQRHSKLFSNPSALMFSYFSYVPTPKIKKEKKIRGRAVKAKTVKAQ